jgi:hypothetical protein
MCTESPVARAFYEAIKRRFGDRVFFLGIVGDSAHAVRKSGHNCGAMRELSCTDPNFAHAVDIGVFDDATAFEIIKIAYELDVVHYMIFDGTGYRPRHRGGARFVSSGHEGHVHISFGCGSTFFTDFDFDEEIDAMGTREIIARIDELDEDLPEKAAMERLQKRVVNIEEDVDVVKADVKAIRALLEA